MRPRILMICFVMIILVLAGIRLAFLDYSVTESILLYQLEHEIARVQQTNVSLRNQILFAQSFTVIAQKAKLMGFIPAQIVVISGEKKKGR